MKTYVLLGLVLTGSVLTVHADDPFRGYRGTSDISQVGHSVPIPSGSAPAYGPPTVYDPVDQRANWSSQSAPVETWIEAPQHTITVPAIRLDTSVTEPLLDFQNRQTGKQLLVLESQRENCETPSVVLGAQFRASALAAYTNRANKFSYLGRFPPGFDGNTASDVRLLQANQSIVAHAAPYASAYFETLFSDVFSFQSFNQGSWQVRQAYVVIGDLDKTPWYGWLGKKTLDFGDMGTLNPFTQAVPWHYFAPLAEGAGVGYSDGLVHITAAAVNGGRGIRVADSSGVGDLENFVVNGRVTYPIAKETQLTIGAGYIHSTIYDSATTEHINPRITGPRNGALDVNARLDAGPLSLVGEFVTTVDPWPAVQHQVRAWRAEGSYRFDQFRFPTIISAGFSEGIQGESGSQFEFNRQFVLGARVDFAPNIYGTAEWVRSTGFAPLINIATVSDRSVIQDSAVIGLVLVL